MCNLLCLKIKVMSESKQKTHGTKNVPLYQAGQGDYEYIWYVGHRNGEKKICDIHSFLCVYSLQPVCLLQDM